MASKELEEKSSNTKMGDETLVLEKKRSKRRVSFAETTSIHLFIRDEECETPPEVADSSNGGLQRSASDEIRDLLASDDDSDDSDDRPLPDTSFLRPAESPSSGSRFGSASSNNEDNFFGPVSADFIKPGRLSDSAVSDDNHDITMDSTAFSMHFRSLARSDCGEEFKTPTGTHVTSGERSLDQISTSTSGQSMALTASRKRVAGSAFCADTVNDSDNSDAMIVVKENPHRYDFMELSPELDVLLVGDSMDKGASLSSHVECANSIKFIANDSGSGLSNRDVDAHHVSDMKKTSDSAISGVPIDNENLPGSFFSDQTKAAVVSRNVMQVDKDKEARPNAAEPSGNFLSPQSCSEYNQFHDQPIAGSVSSLLSKRAQIFRVSPNGKSKEIVSEKKFSDSISKQVRSASSIEKGVSRLKRFEAFPFCSASKVESNAPRLVPPESLTSSLTRNHLVNKTRNDASINNLAAPVACLDKIFSNVAVDDKIIRSMDKGKYDLRTLGDAESASCTRAGNAELMFLNEASPSLDKPVKSCDISVSPLVIANGERLGPYVSSDNHSKEIVPSTESHCSLLDISFNDLKCNWETRNSPEINAKRNIPASPSFQEPILRVDRDVSRKSDDIASKSASSLCIERNQGAERPFPKDRHVEAGFSEMENEDSMLRSVYGFSVVPECSQAASKDEVSDSCKVVVTGANVEDGLVSAREQPGFNRKSVTDFSPADNNRNELQIQVCKSPIKVLSCGLVQKKQSDENADNTALTTRSYQLNKHVKDDQLLQKPSNVCDSDRSSTLKRKLFDQVEDDVDASLQHKLKLRKGQKHSEGSSEVPNSIGSDASRDWVDVYTSFCGKTELFPSSLQNLDLAQVRKMNEIVVHLDRMKTYELLHHDMCSQRDFDAAHLLRMKRLRDTKLLLYKNLYQKAKLQLMRLEREKLQDQIQQLDLRVEESNNLISSYHGSNIHAQKKFELGLFPSGSRHIDLGGISLGADDITSLRKELASSQRKIRHLHDTFHVYNKEKKELSCTETIVHARKYLRERVACQQLRSEFQLCQVASIGAMNEELNFLIDYAGIMAQRFIVKSHSTSELYVSNTLDDVKIRKMFRSKDACTAFSFVFCGETHFAYSGIGTFTQKIQKSTSLLQSLLDVIQEVELAMSKLQNISGINFLQPSAGKLDLRLSFTDFKSGERVLLSIDITCLQWGIYPSEALPYEVTGKAAGRQESLQLLIDNIKSAVGGVKRGYRRILRLCQCVSRTIQVHYMS